MWPTVCICVLRDLRLYCLFFCSFVLVFFCSVVLSVVLFFSSVVCFSVHRLAVPAGKDDEIQKGEKVKRGGKRKTVSILYLITKKRIIGFGGVF